MKRTYTTRPRRASALNRVIWWMIYAAALFIFIGGGVRI